MVPAGVPTKHEAVHEREVCCCCNTAAQHRCRQQRENETCGKKQGLRLRVVLIGESIQAQESALSLLLTLLLSIGGVALLGAGPGGLFLASRALAPARLAWANQQRFIADAAHELRTPLTLLRADAEVLLRSRARLSAEDAALLEDIVAEANHMARLATNLLTLARLDNRSSHQEALSLCRKGHCEGAPLLVQSLISW